MRRFAGPRRGSAVCAALLLAACAGAPTIRPNGYLHVIETSTRGTIGESDAPVRLIVHTTTPTALASQLRPEVVERVESDRLVVELSGYPGRFYDGPDDLRAPTFVAAWEHEAIRAWADEIQTAVGRRPTVDEVRAAVNAGVEPTSPRGFDLAVRVAQHREGDCTEYAVVTAALARRFGYPARIVMGLLVLSDPDSGRAQAFGHAWNEIADEDGWRVIDSTRNEGARILGYLPEFALEDEGPGYGRMAIKMLHRTPTLVEVIAASR